MTDEDRALDSLGSYNLSIACLREIAIRAGRIRPSPDRPDEQRWSREGSVPNHHLESARLGVER